MNLRALQDCVIIQRDEVRHPFLALVRDDPMETGVVVAAGPDCKALKIGDHLYFGTAQEFRYDGKDYLVMREQHVTGVFNG